MEALCATFTIETTVWFCCQKPTGADNSDSDSGGDDDEDDKNGEGTRALAVRQAVACICACVRWIELAADGPPPGANDALRNCVSMWRAKFKDWQEPCGNHLNVPDLLFVAACHLRVALMPTAARPFQRAPEAIVKLRADLQLALREWNRAPSSLHTDYLATINTCSRAIVMWGSLVAPVRLVDTTLSPEDVSMLTMNVNVHQNLDNRARNTDLPRTDADAPVLASERKLDVEELLHSFVCLASRYSFFASLHAAARRAASEPQTELHRRIAAEAVRPPIDLVSANLAKLPAVFRECSRISLPQFVHSAINYTIWKWTLSVGAMEASVYRRCRRHNNSHTGLLAHGANNRVAQVESGDCVDSRTDCGHAAGRLGACRRNQRLRRRLCRVARAHASVPPRRVALDVVAPVVYRNRHALPRRLCGSCTRHSAQVCHHWAQQVQHAPAPSRDSARVCNVVCTRTFTGLARRDTRGVHLSMGLANCALLRWPRRARSVTSADSESHRTAVLLKRNSKPLWVEAWQNFTHTGHKRKIKIQVRTFPRRQAANLAVFVG